MISISSSVLCALACFVSAGSVANAFQSTTLPIPLQVRPPFLHSRCLSRKGLPNSKRSSFSQRYKRNSHIPGGTTVTPLLGTALLQENASPYPRTRRTTAVYSLILANLVVFLSDNVLRLPFARRHFYLSTWNWKWWQLLTTCFCHGDRSHLSNNLFLLLLFGRSVEDELGGTGLMVSYAFCGIFSSLASIALLPKYTVSIGASGAVFGLFAVSVLSKLSWRDLFNWRKVVEVAILGEFAVRQLVSELSTVAGGGTAGTNHVAHLAGAAAGALLVFFMRVTVNRFERAGNDPKRIGPNV